MPLTMMARVSGIDHIKVSFTKLFNYCKISSDHPIKKNFPKFNGGFF